MKLSPEDAQTIISRSTKAFEMIADRYEEVTGEEMSDADYDVLSDRLSETIGDFLTGN